MKIIKLKILITLIFMVVYMMNCSKNNSGSELDLIAEEYVRLLLFAEQYDEDIVDAYYGPDIYKPSQAEAVNLENPPFDSLVNTALNLRTRLDSYSPSENDNLEFKRYKHLQAQLRAVHTRLRIVSGEKLAYNEESKLIYDVVVPEFSDSYFDSILKQLETQVPGDGPLMDRWKEFKEQFIVPDDKMEIVLQTAIDEARLRTLKHFNLPEAESFKLELVKDVSWGAYNWYLGDYQSLIQYNSSMPMRVTSAIGLACHEGYPGHHVAGILQDSILYQKNGWIEFSIVPLFSPTSIFSEGLANFCVDLAFPDVDRLEFETSVLCPLAGIDPVNLKLYHELSKLFDGLGWVTQIAARDYLDGTKSYDETIVWLTKYEGAKLEEIKRGISFTEQYRAYRVTYRMGEALVRNYMKRMAPDDPERQWEILWELCSTPVIPSDIAE